MANTKLLPFFLNPKNIYLRICINSICGFTSAYMHACINLLHIHYLPEFGTDMLSTCSVQQQLFTREQTSPVGGRPGEWTVLYTTRLLTPVNACNVTGGYVWGGFYHPVYHSQQCIALQWNIEKLFSYTFKLGVYFTVHSLGSTQTNC